MSAFDAAGDLCLGFWAKAVAANVIQVPDDAQVLEIGSAESDWITPMRTDQPGWHIQGLDCRPSAAGHVGDVLTYDYPPETFDLIVAISAVEHIGLGAYGDPVVPDGDVIAMQRAVSWLKPGGYLYFDVPIRPEHEDTPQFRAYSDVTFRQRLIPPGLTIRWMKAFTPSHPDGPYISVIAQKAA